jgi:DNA-binding NtrC family response regulator
MERSLRMNQPSILILDLNTASNLGETLQRILDISGRVKIYRCHQAQGQGNSAAGGDGDWASVIARCRPDLCFFVFSPALFNQAELLFRRLKDALNGSPTIAVTEAGEPDEILELLKIGVADFITLPLKTFDIYPRVWRLLQNVRREDPLTRTLNERLGMKQLVGESPAFLEQIKKISVVAKTEASILILGETGTGKELCARAIHYLSPRAKLPFVPVNCGAIPQDLVENELFGHEPGAFTGASTAKPGLIQEAHGGTLLLDEVDSLPLQTQAKLLRFLQEKEYRPLGSTKTLHADVRVIAASNNDLEEQARSGKLRRDLYYRLNVIPLTLPPLRERPEDVLLLANHFSAKYAEAFGKPVPCFSPDARQLLLCYDWPGNVRELEHVIERAVAFASHQTICGRDLTLPCGESNGRQESFQEMKARAVAQFEKACIQGLLLAHQGNINKAAQAAKKNRRAFFELMRKHRIDARQFRSAC